MTSQNIPQNVNAIIFGPGFGLKNDAKKYFDAIAENPKACMVKCIDRCNNLTTMASGFSSAKRAEYIEETKTWYPRLLRIVKSRPEYNNAAWLLKYQIKSLLETAEKIK